MPDLRGDLFGEVEHRRRQVERRRVQGLRRLLLDGRRDRWVVVADHRREHAAEEVEVPRPLDVPHPAALTAFDRDRVCVVGREERRHHPAVLGEEFCIRGHLGDARPPADWSGPEPRKLSIDVSGAGPRRSLVDRVEVRSGRSGAGPADGYVRCHGDRHRRGGRLRSRRWCRLVTHHAAQLRSGRSIGVRCRRDPGGRGGVLDRGSRPCRQCPRSSSRPNARSTSRTS